MKTFSVEARFIVEYLVEAEDAYIASRIVAGAIEGEMEMNDSKFINVICVTELPE